MDTEDNKGKKASDYEETKMYKKIKKSLLAQIGGKTAAAHFTDIVDTYMDLWCQRQMLRDDIHTRGVFVLYDNGGGQQGTRRNDSIQDELKVTAQMLNIRSSIGIKEAAGGYVPL